MLPSFSSYNNEFCLGSPDVLFDMKPSVFNFEIKEEDLCEDFLDEHFSIFEENFNEKTEGKHSDNSSPNKDSNVWDSSIDIQDFKLQRIDFSNLGTPKVEKCDRVYSRNDVDSKTMNQNRESPSSHLSNRHDVVNKKILRAFKRLLKRSFNDFLKSNSSENTKKSIVHNFRDFANYLFVKFVDSSSSEGRISKDDMVSYLQVLINYNQMKKRRLPKSDKLKLHQVTEALYNYSHSKFYEFIRIPEISFLLQAVIRKNGEENFIKAIKGNNKGVLNRHLKYVLQTSEDSITLELS
jgi:hypothetical protein